MPLLIDPPPGDEPRYERNAQGIWVISSTARLARPMPTNGDKPSSPPLCPFCEGNESSTPPEVFAVRNGSAADGPGWSVRVVPNLYPGVVPLTSSDDDTSNNSCAGYGRHEVIIERPDHASDITDLPAEHFGNVMMAYRQRLRAMGEDSRLKYALIFKNCGRLAGASQEHVHAQIMGLAVLPPLIEDLLSRESNVENLLAGHPTVVMTTPHFVAYTPEPSLFPLEVWVAPRVRDPDFRLLKDEQSIELGKMMRDLLLSLARMIEPCSYNYFLHTNSLDGIERRFDRWHFKIVPRLETLAGCELGAGVYMNPIRPAWAAEQYRKILGSLADE